MEEKRDGGPKTSRDRVAAAEEAGEGMIEYETHIEVRAPKGVDADRLGDAYDQIVESGVLVGATMTYNLDEGWIGLRYYIEAANPRQAIDRGAGELFAALGIKRRPKAADFIAMEAEPYLDPEFAEPVSQAEIGRRIGVSRERVRQLAAMEGFPAPVIRSGHAVLYRWGEAKEWNEKRLRATKQPRRESVAA